MDFMRLLKSVEELLYEVVTWILFYPLTFWQALRHPLKMMRYAQTELDDKEEDQFDDTLSPPIFLLLTLFIAHLLENRLSAPIGALLPKVLQDELNLLLFRAVAFSVFPLLLALLTVLHRAFRLTRRSLKPAFYSQCFVTVPFILAADIALMLSQHGSGTADIVALLIAASAFGWYAAVQTEWLAAAGVGRVRAAMMAVAAIVLGAFLVLLITLVTLAATTA